MNRRVKRVKAWAVLHHGKTMIDPMWGADIYPSLKDAKGNVRTNLSIFRIKTIAVPCEIVYSLPKKGRKKK